MAAPKKPQRIGPFPLGMDNRVPDTDMALADGGHLLRDAFNVDIPVSGKPKTRRGQTLTDLAVTDGHSLWAPIGGDYGLYCDSGAIYRMDVAADGAVSRTLVASGFGFATPVRYAPVNEAVYFTDGLAVGSYHPRTGPTATWAGTVPTASDDRQLVPMPAGSCIAHQAGGVLLVAVGSVLLWSVPYKQNLRDASANYEMFPGPIACVITVEGGVFVCTDTETYFAAGGFPAENLQRVLAYGAPEQQPGYRQDGGAHWMSAEGIVSCAKTGEFGNLQDEHIAMNVTGAAATLWREHDGMQSIVSALSAPSSMRAGVGSFAEIRMFRKE